jgi:cysteinyl-tRNA synthetase
MNQAIANIQNLIRLGYAYTSEVPNYGIFVMASAQKVHFPNNAIPVRHPIVQDNPLYLKNPQDYPIWIPYKLGRSSPWGQGEPSCNYYLLNF